MSSSSSIHQAQKPRTGISSLFKRKERAPQTMPNTASHTQPNAANAAALESLDRQRTKARYLAAAKALESVVKGHEKK